MADEVTKKDLQSLQGYVNAKIAALGKVIKGDPAIKELQSFQKWVEGPLFDRINRMDDRIKKLEDAKK